MSDEKKLAKVENKYLMTPEDLIVKGIESNVSVETMERLLAMRKELKIEKAKEEFDKAMAKFQLECPVIERTRAVKEKDKTTVRYKYTPLEDIKKQVQKLIADNGFSYIFKIKNEEGFLTAICEVTHKDGYSKETEFSVPISEEQFMSAVQKYGARATFAKRYAFINSFGIIIGGEDNDAQETKKEAKKITVQDVVATIRKYKTREQIEKGKKWLESAGYNEAQANVILRALEEQEKCV